MRFEFCEGHLDRVEVGRVRRQVAQLRPGGLDYPADFVILVGGQIIHHHDVTWFESGDQASLQIDAKNLAGHRFVDDEGGGDGVVAQRRNEGGDLPVTVRHFADQTLAATTATTQPRHVG